MTRVGPLDASSATRLLEEKELDLQLAAKIGQELLNRNKRLEEKIETLENQVTASTELITQLRHELSIKSDLLRVYTDDINDDECNDSNDYASSEAEADQQHNVELLEKRIQALEKENRGLHEQAIQLASEASEVESKEERLVSDAFKHLSEANVRIGFLNEQCALKNDESSRQQQQITQLLAQICDLQKRNRDSNRRNEELQSSLDVYKEVQEELTTELFDFKEKYKEVVELLHDTQHQLKKARKHKYYHNSGLSDDSNSPVEGFASLQFELQATTKRRSEPQDMPVTPSMPADTSVLSQGSSPKSVYDDNASYTVSRDHTHSPDLFAYDRSMSHLTLENALRQAELDHCDPFLIDNNDDMNAAEDIFGQQDDDDVIMGGPMGVTSLNSDHNEDLMAVREDLAQEDGYEDQDVIDDEEDEEFMTMGKIQTVGQLQMPHYLRSDGHQRQLGCVPKLEGRRTILSDFESAPLSVYSQPPNDRASSTLSRRSEGIRSRGSSDKLLEETLRRLTPEELERRRNKTFSSDHSGSPSTSAGGAQVSSFRLPSSVRIIKPLEGSLTLHHWQRLATPHLGKVLEPRAGVATKFERPTTTSSSSSLSWLTSSSLGDTVLQPTLTNSMVRHPKSMTPMTTSFLPQSSVRMQTGFNSNASHHNSGQMIGLQEVLEERSIGCWTGSTWSLASHSQVNNNDLDVYSLTPSVMCSPKLLSATNTPLNSPTRRKSLHEEGSTFGFFASVRAAIYGEQQRESQKSKKSQKSTKKFGILEKVEEVGVENLFSNSLSNSELNSASSSREASMEPNSEGTRSSSEELELIRPGSLTMTSNPEGKAKISSRKEDQRPIIKGIGVPSMGVPGHPGTGALLSLRSPNTNSSVEERFSRMRTDLGSVPRRESRPRRSSREEGFIGSVASMLFGKKGGLW